jgi:hypothetical protein
LDKLCAELNVIADSTEALSIVHGCALRQESDSAETRLSDAIVHDMEATAICFRTMKYIEMPAALGERECQKIQEMVDRYETIVSTILNKHKECVRIESNRCVCLLLIHTRSRLSSIIAQGRELQMEVEVINWRQAEQQESKLADMRSSESSSAHMNVEFSADPLAKRSMTD